MADSTTRARKSQSLRVASSAENSTLGHLERAYFTISPARSSTLSGLILSLYSMCRGEVDKNTWIRGDWAWRTASKAASISLGRALAREPTVQSLMIRATSDTDSKSPGEEIAKPASMTSTFRRSSCLATSSFSCRFMLQPGACSPSRSVVSKMRIFLLLSMTTSSFPDQFSIMAPLSADDTRRAYRAR